MAVDVKKALESALDKALTVQAPAAAANLERLRRLSPEASPAELLRKLNKTYLTAVAISGGAAGASAMVPGVGIPAGLADTMAFTEASVFYVLSRAELHGVDSEDIERRRFMAYTVLVGDAADGLLRRLIPRTGKHWSAKIVESVPMSAIRRANRILGPRVVTKYGTRQGVLVLSKQVPLGVGAALGGGGNYVFGRGTIKAADKLFGPAPEDWPSSLSHGAGPTGRSDRIDQDER